MATSTADMKLPGIYRIRNLLDGNVYIGSSANIERRWVGHRSHLRRNMHHCAYLQRAWEKYGEAAFAIEVLEQVAAVELLIEREAWHMEEARKSGAIYNSAPVAGSTFGLKIGPLPEEHRRKISAAKMGKPASDEARRNQGKARNGRKLSAEWKAKIAESMRGQKLPPLTDEHKALISAVHKGKVISPEHRQRLSLAHKGKKQSPEFVARRVAASVAARAKNKAARQQDASTPPAFPA